MKPIKNGYGYYFMDISFMLSFMLFLFIWQLGVINGEYHFNGSEELEVSISYQNDSADSVFIEAFYFFNLHFDLSERRSSNGQQAFDTLIINYLGEDNSQGNHIVTFRAGNVYGSDTIFDFTSFVLSSESDTNWTCTVPPDLRDVIEITPIVNLFDVTPNLFDDAVWINIGEDYEKIKVEVLDMRGRLVAIEEKPETQTFKMDFSHLSSGMYFFRLIREDKLLTVIRSVKK